MMRVLWLALLRHLLATIQNQPEGLKASYLDVIRAFLKDNGVTIGSFREAGDALTTLEAAALPFFEDNEEADTGA